MTVAKDEVMKAIRVYLIAKIKALGKGSNAGATLSKNSVFRKDLQEYLIKN
jgi:hypothetical protein